MRLNIERMDQNILFNKNTRILAIDDSPFKRDDIYTNLIGVIIRKDMYIEKILKKEIEVDGMDVTEKIFQMVKENGEGIRIIMVKGVTFGGFNILDTRKLYESINVPIINFMDHRPDMGAIENALKKHFKDWEIRLPLMNEYREMASNSYIHTLGLDYAEAIKFTRQLIKNGKIPEPLRIADIIASIC